MEILLINGTKFLFLVMEIYILRGAFMIWKIHNKLVHDQCFVLHFSAHICDRIVGNVEELRHAWKPSEVDRT